MPKRKTAPRYVRRSERVGDSVRTHYLGCVSDPIARVLMQSEHLSRAIKQSVGETTEIELQLQERLETCQMVLSATITRLVDRYWQEPPPMPPDYPPSLFKRSNMTNPEHPDSDTVSLSQDDWERVVEEATQGDEAALQELKQVLRDNPAIRERLGDLSRHVQGMLIELFGAESVATRESLRLQIQELREKLDHGETDPLERLLIEELLTTKLDLSIQQLGCLRPHVKETVRRRWERRMDRAQKRHLAAVSALAELREFLYGPEPFNEKET